MSSGAQNASRIPSLDGLRAISITLVLLFHMAGTRNSPFDGNTHFSLAEMGVRVFFVISGFLITSILTSEIKKRGRISLGKFYFRRALRLFPAFYAFLAVVLLLVNLGLAEIKPWDVLAAVGYAMNYHPDHAWVFGHCWSLAVEEQFYFLWPAVLGLLGVRRGIGFAAVYLALAPVIRVVEWHFFPAWRVGIGQTFPTIADAIATGCVLAGVRGWLHANEFYGKLQRSPAFLLVPAAVLAANYFEAYP
ncbi:MAG TPA: acyltransferase, partial [Polyangiaceae bacterium]